MSGLTVFKQATMGKGHYINLLHDLSLPEDCPDRWTAEVVIEGGEDSPALDVLPHWHRRHSERITMVEGRVRATVGGKTSVIRAGETIFIPKRTLHCIKGFAGERMVLRERADPAGDYKLVLFDEVANLGSKKPRFWHQMRAFYDGDTYPHLGLGWKWFDFAWFASLGAIAKLFLPAKQKLE